MESDLHAALLIAIVGATLVVSVARRARPTLRRVGGAWCAALIASVSVQALTLHLCDEGTPYTQWLVPAVCLGTALSCVGSPRVRGWMAAILIASMLLLTSHFKALVHRDEYGGSAQAGQRQLRGTLSGLRSSLRALTAEIPAEERGPVAPCPLAEHPAIAPRLRERGLRVEAEAVFNTRLWHTPLTGIYAQSRQPVVAWFPGGRPSEGAEAVSFRPVRQ